MKLKELKTVADRRKYFEKLIGFKLDSLSVYPPGLDLAQNKNCENMIGAVSIPVGIAGPLKVNGDYAKGDFYLPLATTEGALVASVNRGAKAVSQSGGVNVICQDVGITRGPVFETNGLKESISMESWLKQNILVLQELTQIISSHLKFL